MLRDLGQPSHLLILAVVVVVLFGGKRLPDAARGLGRSMRIFKSEIKQMGDDKPGAAPPAAPPAAPQPLEGRVVSDPSRTAAPTEQRRDA